MPFLLVRWSLPSCASANFYSSDMSIALPAFNRSEYQFLFSWIEIWPAKQRLFLQSLLCSQFTSPALHCELLEKLWLFTIQTQPSHANTCMNSSCFLPYKHSIMIFCYCTCTHVMDLLYQCWGFDCYLWLNWFLNVSIQWTVHAVVVLTCTDSISNYYQHLLNSGQNSRLIANKKHKTIHDGRG